jgi:choline dehydrogenase-like flavoprotein
VSENLQLSDPGDVESYFQSSRYLADRLLTPLAQSEYGKRFAEAVDSAGHGAADLSDVSNIRYKDGAWVVNSLFNVTDPAWPRNTPAVLLRERASMSNLVVETGAQVRRVNFERNRAVSVSVGDETVMARKGVIMAAGAIYTPQLLQLSGIGEAQLLEKLGVEQLVELPVGRNFVDRLTWTIQIIAPQALDKFLGLTVAADGDAGLTFESVGGASVDSYMAIPSLGLAPAKNREAYLRPIMKFIVEDTPIAKLMDRFTNVLALVQDTKSRGTVEATSLDSAVPPTVTANFFAEEEDVASQIANLKQLLSIAKQSALDDYRMTTLLDALAEVWPVGLLSLSQINDLVRAGISLLPDLNGLPDFLAGIFTCQAYGFVSLPCPPADETKWEQWLKDNVLSTYHYFGTAAVGSVVEPGSFAVKGTEGLYVVDASVIPKATRVNPVGTIMTVGHFVGSKLARESASQVIV